MLTFLKWLGIADIVSLPIFLASVKWSSAPDPNEAIGFDETHGYRSVTREKSDVIRKLQCVQEKQRMIGKLISDTDMRASARKRPTVVCIDNQPGPPEERWQPLLSFQGYNIRLVKSCSEALLCSEVEPVDAIVVTNRLTAAQIVMDVMGLISARRISPVVLLEKNKAARACKQMPEIWAERVHDMTSLVSLLHRKMEASQKSPVYVRRYDGVPLHWPFSVLADCNGEIVAVPGNTLSVGCNGLFGKLEYEVRIGEMVLVELGDDCDKDRGFYRAQIRCRLGELYGMVFDEPLLRQLDCFHDAIPSSCSTQGSSDQGSLKRLFEQGRLSIFRFYRSCCNCETWRKLVRQSWLTGMRRSTFLLIPMILVGAPMTPCQALAGVGLRDTEVSPLTNGARAANHPDSRAPANTSSSAAQGDGSFASKVDIFAGYSYLYPDGSITINLQNQTGICGCFDVTKMGVIASGAVYLSRNFGLQLDAASHGQWTDGRSNNDEFLTVSAGLIARYPYQTLTLFAHALTGGAEVGGPLKEPLQWGWGIMAGGGLDIETPALKHRLAIRLIQADYQYMNINRGSDIYSGISTVGAVQASAGLVFHVGHISAPYVAPAILSCLPSQKSVFPGEPLTIHAEANFLNPRLKTAYEWAGTGVQGHEDTATVETENLSPGTYDVRGSVRLGKKAIPYASCTTSYIVKAFDPPIINCMASPSTIRPGESSEINVSALSPQNRLLTYSYESSAGQINGHGNTATFQSTTTASGTVKVTCKVSDDKGKTVTAQTSVNIVAPPPPPPSTPVHAEPLPEVKRLESRLALHSVFFTTGLPEANHPMSGLAESQEKTLTTLAADFKNYLQYTPNARLTLTGHADPRGSTELNQALSERRVNLTKRVLIENGVPETSIETNAVGSERQMTPSQVVQMFMQSPDLGNAERQLVLRNLNTIVLAQNRRVDISLPNSGQQSLRQFPFNATDAEALLAEKLATKNPRIKTGK
jgi:outer membrane protein OmpA-like peptidoglycan-associated protein